MYVRCVLVKVVVKVIQWVLDENKINKMSLNQAPVDTLIIVEKMMKQVIKWLNNPLPFGCTHISKCHLPWKIQS